MNILTKTVQSVKEFDAAIVAAEKEFSESREQIFATYSEGVAAEKLGEAREVLTAFEMNATDIAREAVAEDFAAARSAVLEFIAKSVPDDFPATLAAIQAKGENITEYEAASFLKKYEGNYTAYSSILNILEGNSPLLEALARSSRVRGVYVKKPDALDNEIVAMEKRVLNWIQTRTSGNFDSEYYSRLFTKESGNPIQMLAERIEEYLSGGFIINGNRHNEPSYKVN